MITQLKEKVLNGGQITREEAILLSNAVDKQALYRAAGEIRDKRVGRRFDTCSIINARSGRCSENCKWCAQSALFKTKIYPLHNRHSNGLNRDKSSHLPVRTLLYSF